VCVSAVSSIVQACVCPEAMPRFSMRTEKYFFAFFEAKDYSNNDLKAQDGTTPAVVQQIRQYESKLERQKREIAPAYQQSICAAHQLSGANILGNATPLSNLNQLQVDTQPRLVVFGFDADQKRGEHFKRHMAGLVKELGAHRVLLKGDPKNFTRGISETSSAIV
jgi:hypothetical protein